MENNIDTTKATARSAEFSAGTPLPPIGMLGFVDSCKIYDSSDYNLEYKKYELFKANILVCFWLILLSKQRKNFNTTKVFQNVA